MSDIARANTLPEFNYSILSSEEKLATLENEKRLREIFERYQPEIGEVLYKQQQVLANHKNGVFLQWLEAVGFKKQSAYNYINQYKFVQNLDNIQEKDLFLNAPTSLKHEMSKPSADPEINKKVFAGDITTHKEYKELEKQKKEAESRAKELEELAQREKERAERASEKTDDLITEVNRLNKQISQNLVVEKTIYEEVIPPEVQEEQEQLIKINSRLQEELKKANFQLEAYKEMNDPAQGKAESEAKVSNFSSRIKSFLREMAPLGYVGNEVFRTSYNAQRDYNEALTALEKWCSDIRQKLKETQSTMVIEGE